MQKSWILAASILIALTGCTTKKSVDYQKPQSECEIDGISAPSWVCGNDQSPPGGVYLGIGSAPMSKLGYGFTVREAAADARSNLAQRIETSIKDKIERFARSTGVQKNEVADKVSTQVSKQVAKVTLNDSKQIRSWQHPENGALFVMVSVSEENVNREAKSGVLSSYKNNDALWQQIQSKEALAELEAEFHKK